MVERVLFPYLPDWKSPVRIRYQWLTEVIDADAGNEQRRALRTTPRKTITFAVQVVTSELTKIRTMFATSLNLPWIVAEPTRFVKLTADSAAGSRQIVVSSVPAWLKVGTEIVLSSYAKDTRMAVVSGIVGNTLTLSNDPGAWAAGAAVYYAVTGNVGTPPSISMLTSGVAEFEFSVSVDPGSEDYPATTAAATYEGQEILTLSPNWVNPVSIDLDWPVSNVDAEYGRIVTYRPIDFATDITSFDVLFDTPTDVENFVAMYQRMRGACGEFFAPTFVSDLTPAAGTSVIVGQSSLNVEGSEVADALTSDPVRSHIRVRLVNGTIMDRPVVALTDIGNERSQLTVSPTWSTSGAVSTISWILNSRFATDDLEIEWLNDSVAQTRISLKSLPTPNAGDYIHLRSTLLNDDRETLAGDDREVIYF